ncbi:MAG: hypothetical protein SGCHY_003279, partial [Lobulomycetales sp.]
KVGFQDLKLDDPMIYDSLLWIKENDISEMDLGLTFSVNLQDGRTIDLKSQGSNIALTEENKEEYMRLYTRLRLVELTRPQFKAMKNGIADVMTVKAWAKRRAVMLGEEPFCAREDLELEIGGVQMINFEDWKAYSVYVRPGGLNASRACKRTKRLFWEVVNDMDQLERASLLKFVTGSSRAPLGGFAELNPPFTISFDDQLTENHRPAARACFNKLIIPAYSTKKVMKERLLESMAVQVFDYC